jgi:hypothetical protein
MTESHRRKTTANDSYLIKMPLFQAVSSVRDSSTMLPHTFKPHPYSVVMGRGKDSANATGSRRLAILVDIQLNNYVKAKSRRAKAFVIAQVLETVQQACPQGAFVKFDHINWWEVADNAAREKIGTMFRDRLHDTYKSSTKSKVAKRRARKALVQHGRQSILSLSSTETSATDTSDSVEPLPFNQSIYQGHDCCNSFLSAGVIPSNLFDLSDTTPWTENKVTFVPTSEECAAKSEFAPQIIGGGRDISHCHRH